MTSMDYTYLIHTYLEGRLEEPLEEVLFGELSRNGALRKELSAQINLTNAAKRDASSILPTEAEKTALFAELGFAEIASAESTLVESALVESVVAESIGAAEALSGASNLSVVQSVVLMLCSAIALTLGVRSDSVFYANNTENIHNEVSERQALKLPLLVMSMPQERTESRFSDNVMSNYAFSQKPLPSASNLVAEDGNVNEESQEQVYSSSDVFNSANTDIQAVKTFVAEYPLQTQARLPLGIKHRPQLSSTFLQMSDNMIEQFPVQLGIRHLLGGGKLGLHGAIQYALNKEQAIGFEGGTEAARLLVRNAGNGDVRAMSANDESVFSGTAYYRHTFTRFALLPNKALVPFVQGGIGVVGRSGAVQGMGGLRFDVAPELSFVLAAEVKMPVFYAEQHFQSKTGISIGMQYHISDK